MGGGCTRTRSRVCAEGNGESAEASLGRLRQCIAGSPARGDATEFLARATILRRDLTSPWAPRAREPGGTQLLEARAADRGGPISEA